MERLDNQFKSLEVHMSSSKTYIMSTTHSVIDDPNDELLPAPVPGTEKAQIRFDAESFPERTITAGGATVTLAQFAGLCKAIPAVSEEIRLSIIEDQS